MTENLHSRRTIVQGAAWSVPVLALATAVPAGASTSCAASSSDLYYAVVGTDLVITNNNASGCAWTDGLFVAYQVYLYPYPPSPYLVGGIAGVKVLDRVQRVYYSQVALGPRTIEAGSSIVLPITIQPTSNPDGDISFASGDHAFYQKFILSDGSYFVDGTNRIAHGEDYGIDVFGPRPFDAPNIPG
ncbi:MAG: hypothetical protein WA971_12930 [Microbacterium sp.]